MLSLKTKGHLKKTRHKKSKAVQQTPKTCSLWLLPPEVEGEFLLLRIPCTSETESRDHWATAGRKASSWRNSLHGTRRQHTTCSFLSSARKSSVYVGQSRQSLFLNHPYSKSESGKSVQAFINTRLIKSCFQSAILWVLYSSEVLQGRARVFIKYFP